MRMALSAIGGKDQEKECKIDHYMPVSKFALLTRYGNRPEKKESMEHLGSVITSIVKIYVNVDRLLLTQRKIDRSEGFRIEPKNYHPTQPLS